VRDAVVVRRWTAAAQWLLVAAAAYSGALAVNAALAFWLDPGTEPAVVAPAPALAGKRAAADADTREYSVILDRNLFGSEPITVSARADAPTGATASPELRLLGTAQIDDRGYAVIEDVAGKRQEVFVVGETVFEGPTLVAVRPGSADILDHGRKQTLEISQPPGADDAGRSGASKKDGKTDSIRQTGTNTYMVDRREVQHSIDNLNRIATQMRAVPYLKDGTTIGFRVFNIKNGSIFERMGLKNGDVIQAVNGVDLDSPTKALALLEDLQTTDEIRVNLLRDNSPSTLSYSVR
jgi:general secretion pathway protein C